MTGKIRPHLPAIGCLLLLALAALGRVLVDANLVLSSSAGEVASQFLYSRGFAAAEMRGGNFPLWNPFLYSGTPFLGDFSSALLYPPNLIFLFAPLSLAISWSFAVHLFLLGAGMYAWAVAQGLGKTASFTAGTAAMFSATVMVPIQSGHLSDLCSMAWMPFVFLGMVRWMAVRSWGWIAVAAGAAALQIYAGQVAYFVLGALVSALYALTLPWKDVPNRVILAAGLMGIYPLALVLGAAQLLPGLAAGAEMVRSIESGNAASSFPWGNSLTLLVPWMFGKLPAANLFGGLGIFLLAVFGLWNSGRIRWRWILLLTGLLLLAAGVFSPVGRILFGVLPGWVDFRGASQFGFFVGLFLSLSAGLGVGDLLSRKLTAPWPAFLAGALAILLLVASMAFRGPTGGDLLESLIPVASGVGELRPAEADGETESRVAAIRTANALRQSGLVMGGFAILWGWGQRRRGVRFLLVLAAVAEIFFFARSTVATFPYQPALYEPVRQALWNIPGDFRILNLFNPNANMLLKREGIWGKGSAVLQRYSQLLGGSQGEWSEQGPSRPHPVWEMLRCAFKAVPEGENVELVHTGKPYPRFYFAAEYEVMEPERLLETLARPEGDWRQKVLLEEEPIPAPSGKSSRVHLSVRDVSINHYTLEITTDADTLLVNTDSYSKDWRAVSLPGSAQIVYRILPVNYSLRGIPLTAGSHVLRLEYRPSGLAAGSILTLGALLALAGWFSFPFWSRYLGAIGEGPTEAGS